MGCFQTKIKDKNDPAVIKEQFSTVFLHDTRMGTTLNLDQTYKDHLKQELEAQRYNLRQTATIYPKKDHREAGLKYRPGEYFYEGEIGPNGEMTGDGRITVLPFQHHYCGQFRQGRAHGEGTVEIANLKGRDQGKRQIVEGKWEQGMVKEVRLKTERGEKIVITRVERGVVEIKFQDGRLYRGQLGGRMDDEQFTVTDGSRVEGHFKNGVLEGEGKYQDKRGDLVYTGNFRNGLFNGKGRLYDKRRGVQLEIEWKDNKPEGDGVMIHRNRQYEVRYDEKGRRVRLLTSDIGIK